MFVCNNANKNKTKIFAQCGDRDDSPQNCVLCNLQWFIALNICCISALPPVQSEHLKRKVSVKEI